MAEEIKEQENQANSLFERFMNAGKVTVFESGLERPDYIQDRPFFNLLPKGKTTHINMGEKPASLFVLTPEEQEKSPALNTESHQFLQEMENRFRSVMPGVTIFIIDPDAVQGRYLMDEKPDRSLQKSLFMYVEDKLQKANADEKKTFLTQEEILKMVAEAGITDRSPFSMRSAIGASTENLAGFGNVNLVVADNPDAMEANVLGDAVIGAEERRVKEGITHDEFRRLVLYHELGHATDHNYASARNSVDKIVEPELNSVMSRHRTECIADAHAVMQLARDFGNTKCAALWGDCRMEYLRVSVDRRLEDTKYDSEFIQKLTEAEKKVRAINPEDPDYENKYKQYMNDKVIAKTIDEMGSPLAYHTTDVIDATIKWTEEHLKDGSLQKMTDLEVIKQAQVMSETHGLTRQQMSEISIALAKGEKHPKYEQMMDRVQVARDNMPMDNKEIEKQYELQRELRAVMMEQQFAKALGLPSPKPTMSPELQEEYTKEVKKTQLMAQYGALVSMSYETALFDAFEDTGYSREDMHKLISQQKEYLRVVGKEGNAKGKTDVFAANKLKVLDAVIDQAPGVQTALNANKRVKEQVAGIKSATEVSGEAALVHFVKNEFRVAKAMEDVFMKALKRNPETMTVHEQIDAMRSENKSFGKALVAEKETQIAAFAVRSDKALWAKVSQDEELAAMIDQKAKQKPTTTLSQYQMIAGNPNKDLVADLLESTMTMHDHLAKKVVENKDVTEILDKKEKRLSNGLKTLVEVIKKEEEKAKEAVKDGKAPVKKQVKAISPLNLKNVKMAVPEKKDIITMQPIQAALNSKKGR